MLRLGKRGNKKDQISSKKIGVDLSQWRRTLLNQRKISKNLLLWMRVIEPKSKSIHVVMKLPDERTHRWWFSWFCKSTEIAWHTSTALWANWNQKALAIEPLRTYPGGDRCRAGPKNDGVRQTRKISSTPTGGCLGALQHFVRHYNPMQDYRERRGYSSFLEADTL